MKILSATQIRQLDRVTIKKQHLTSAELMERAATALAEWFFEKFPLNAQAPDTNPTLHIICGPGNNGGDGLALARLLHQADYAPQVWLLPAAKYSADWLHQSQQLPDGLLAAELSTSSLPAIAPTDIVVDALFGTGLSRPLAGLAATVAQHLNSSPAATIVAVDLPSGLLAEAPQPPTSAVVRATHTVSFGQPKLAFLLPQNGEFVGEWQARDIGLDQSFIAAAVTPWFFTDAAAVAGTLPARPRFSYKNTFGHALLLAGSRGKMGAAVLAAGACLRSGVGLLTAHIPGSGYNIIQTTQPEAMCLPDAQPDFISELPDLAAYQAAGIGPGLGQAAPTLAVLRQLLTQAAQSTAKRPHPLPLVIDADALNLLGQHRELLALLPENTVLTPHVGEFTRLTEEARDDYHRLELLVAFARKYRCLVVLKGAYTCLATPGGELHFNSSGNSGMATGGSGDVLTGVLLALRAHAQLPAFEAVRLGVYAHGRAGDLAAAQTGQAGLVAGDIVRHLGPALQALTN